MFELMGERITWATRGLRRFRRSRQILYLQESFDLTQLVAVREMSDAVGFIDC